MNRDLRQIRLLSPEVSNQIAAGEVVERPASVLKELVENSLDANSTQIDVTLENGGQTLISVRDNGAGIPSSQLELAITRHATSKIGSFEDLENIRSYGFRGEALPSIASVSHFRIASACLAEQESGAMPAGVAASLEVDHGQLRGLKQAPLPAGTLVEVRDLFSRMPARLKFLKNAATEQKRCLHWLSRLGLARLDCGFSLKTGSRPLLDFAKTQNLRQRLEKIWPADVAQSLVPFDSSMHGIRAHGLAAPPYLRLPRADRMYFYVNGRAINDKRLLAAARDAYKGRIVGREYPQIVLFLEMEPGLVDVNAHPAKTEVRFRNESIVFSAIFGALGKCFESISIAGENLASPWQGMQKERIMPWPERKQQPLEEWKATRPASAPTPPVAAKSPESPRKSRADVLAEAPAAYGSAPAAPRVSENFTYLGQVLDTYLVLRDQANNLALLDQHAAHERVLYNRLEKTREAAPAHVLLVPLVLPLPQEGLPETLAETLRNAGFSFATENGSLSATHIPDIFSRQEARAFLEEALEGGADTPDSIFASMACKAAIKAGQKLGLDEAMGLLSQWQYTANADFCPHGRPCVLRWDAAMLEKLFKRGV